MLVEQMSVLVMGFPKVALKVVTKGNMKAEMLALKKVEVKVYLMVVLLADLMEMMTVEMLVVRVGM